MPGPALWYSDNVIDANLARHLDGPVGGAIVDDQHFHLVHAHYVARNARHRFRQRMLFVETGYLDNQFHFFCKIMRLQLENPLTLKQ
jgi:hypothetical protein